MENVDLEKRMAEFRIRLKKHGLKVTQQRYAVHEAMLKLGHASADMVTEEIVKEGKTKVTVASCAVSGSIEHIIAIEVRALYMKCGWTCDTITLTLAS